ncbi:unnamed protein product [Scytosiphon promiscuus]
MIAGIVAFATLAVVSDGFAVVPPSSRSPPGTLADAATVSKATPGNRPRAHTVTTKLSVATGTGPGTATSTPVYDQKSWVLGYESADGEDQYLMEPSEGSVPKDIEGTFFRNGPAKFKVGEDQVKHPFDGDGMVMAISFSEDGAYFRNRFVKTKGYKKELEAGKMLYRGFSNLPGGPLKNAFRIGRKNLANTNVIHWGGVLLALWEGGLPHRIDPKSLDTFGETFLGETIDENRPIFSAHPRVDAKRNRLVSFGSHNMKETRVYEYNSDFKMVQSRLLKEVDGFLHDFAVTENYYVFLSPPVGLNPLKWVLGLDTMGSALKWEGDSKPAKFVVVPRDPSKEIKSIPIPAKFCFHFANAFEDAKNGEVVVDLVQADFLMLDSDDGGGKPVWESVDWSKLPKNKLQRCRLDVSSQEGSLVETSLLYGKNCDFPSINPKVSCQEHRYVWASCGGVEGEEACPAQGVVKVDTMEGTTQMWIPEPHEFLGEPTFIPRKGAPSDAAEDDGYIAHTLVNGRDHKTEVVILDAADIAKGPVCRLPLKGFVPHCLHGEFAEDVVLTPEQIEKSFALTDLFGKKGWNVAKSEFSGLGLNSVMD